MPDRSESYSEGERVFAPPQGAYDADWVAQSARQSDPGLPPETAVLLAADAWVHLQASPDADAPEVARALLADHPESGATAANVVARAALEFIGAYDVPRGPA